MQICKREVSTKEGQVIYKVDNQSIIMGSDTCWKVGGGPRENLAPTTKDFERRYCFAKNGGGAWPPATPSSEALIMIRIFIL